MMEIYSPQKQIMICKDVWLDFVYFFLGTQENSFASAGIWILQSSAHFAKPQPVSLFLSDIYCLSQVVSTWPRFDFK